LTCWILFCRARWIERAFKRWRWSYKNAKYKSPRKYAAANLRYYVQYVTGIVRYPLDRLKFLDEARFDAKSLQRKKGVSRIGQPVIRVHRQNGADLWLCMRPVMPWFALRPASRDRFDVDGVFHSLHLFRVSTLRRPARFLLHHPPHVARPAQRNRRIRAAAGVEQPLGLLWHADGFDSGRLVAVWRHSRECCCVSVCYVRILLIGSFR
jgi:hypothetical protein